MAGLNKPAGNELYRPSVTIRNIIELPGWRPAVGQRVASMFVHGWPVRTLDLCLEL